MERYETVNMPLLLFFFFSLLPFLLFLSLVSPLLFLVLFFFFFTLLSSSFRFRMHTWFLHISFLSSFFSSLSYSRYIFLSLYLLPFLPSPVSSNNILINGCERRGISLCAENGLKSCHQEERKLLLD